ncbi:MAG: CapA family protein [Dysgonamonadaceae bacterium]|jgi:poly-gamma-glutamate synthesis protein (capsule biosynthesis protein)|nr:CapA family protein [Dysgonamonadaceae bacterium]
MKKLFFAMRMVFTPKPVLLFLLFFASAVSFSQEKQVRLLFVGDAMQHLPQVDAAKTDSGTYTYDSCFYLLKDKISAADIACVNFETTLGGKPFSGYPMFSSPDEFASGLKNAGFDVFFLANNHILDKGRKGLERTLDMLDSIRVKHTGVFKSADDRNLSYPLMVIKNGIRIAFLNYVYDTNGLVVEKPNIVNYIDSTEIKSDILTAKLYHPDIIIANMHWGEEYHTSPGAAQKKMAELLIKNGVRIVIGNHPHVIQPLAINSANDSITSVVYYSLGNFISNQQKPNTDGGMVAEISISKRDDDSPVAIDTCNYSLAWVRKFTEKGKVKYRLIPSPRNELEIIPAMTDAESEKMNTFVKNAERIAGKEPINLAAPNLVQ